MWSSLHTALWKDKKVEVAFEPPSEEGEEELRGEPSTAWGRGGSLPAGRVELNVGSQSGSLESLVTRDLHEIQFKLNVRPGL